MMRISLNLIKVLIGNGFWVLTIAIADLVPPNFSLYAHEAPGIPHHGKVQGHSAVEIPPGQPVPTVRLIVHPDPIKGWNLELQTTNFVFAPERINTGGHSNVAEGHAHLYIDGRKVTRLYSNWYYLGTLPAGEHHIRVTLNTNAHQDLLYKGQPIQATATLQVKGAP